MKAFALLCGVFIVAVAINPVSNLHPSAYEATCAFRAFL